MYSTDKIYIYGTQIKEMNLEFVKVVLSIFSETDRTSMHALGRAEFKLAAVSNHRNISDYLHP